MPGATEQGLKAYSKAAVPTAHPGAGLSAEDRERLILEYAPMIRFVAGRIALRLPPHIQIDDLYSAGVLGLIDAVDKYDSNRNAQFKTYAEYRVRGAILDELRAMDWVPRSIRRKSSQLEKAINAITQQLGRAPEEEELAEHLGLDMEQYHQLIHETAGLDLFSIVTTEEGMANFMPGTLMDTALKDKSDNPAESLDKNEIKRIIAQAIDRLPEKEKLVVSLYYYDELTMKEIGKVLSYTESRICQIHSKTMAKLRARLRQYFEELG